MIFVVNVHNFDFTVHNPVEIGVKSKILLYAYFKSISLIFTLLSLDIINAQRLDFERFEVRKKFVIKCN
ncbi:MAG: hypothetical protein EAZ07_00790 [Cytophagales bacterium]|nr:MAG: hypothetical protein EAZ07_00790 [Cytophagales bacterium]